MQWCVLCNQQLYKLGAWWRQPVFTGISLIAAATMLEIAAPQMSELCMIPGKKSSAKGFEQKGLVDLGLLG